MTRVPLVNHRLVVNTASVLRVGILIDGRSALVFCWQQFLDFPVVLGSDAELEIFLGD
jgi:hypothetical protein